MPKLAKRLLLFLGLGFAILGSSIVVNTLRYSPAIFDVKTILLPDINTEKVTKHLSEAVQIKTESLGAVCVNQA